MFLFLLASLFIVFCLAAAAGWWLDAVTLSRLAALGVICLLARLPIFVSRSRLELNRWVIALIGVGFVHLSGVGSPVSPTFDRIGFAVVHGLVIGAYAVVFVRMFSRMRRDQKIEEIFMGRDLWVLNLGLLIFAALWGIGVTRGGWSLPSLVHGFYSGLRPLSLLLLTLLAIRIVPTPRWEWIVSFVLAGLIGVCVLLGGLRFVQVHGYLESAEMRVAEKEMEAAEDSLVLARSANLFLQWASFAQRRLLIHRQILSLDGRHRDVLEITSEYAKARLSGKLDEEPRQWLDRYLEALPLDEAFFPELNRPVKIEPLERLHETLACDPATEEMLLLDFARAGFTDRLAERYAWCGIPPLEQRDAFATALEREDHLGEGSDLSVIFFRGLLAFRSGWYDRAEQHFEQALGINPNHHNALVFLQRISASRGDVRNSGRYRRIAGKITHGEMFGNHKWGLNLSCGLYAAVEVNPGVYRFVMRINGGAAGGQPPRLAVRLDGTTVLRQIVGVKGWHEESFDLSFEEEGRHRLVVIHENPYVGENAAGEREIRILQLEEVEIRHVVE
ncbi:tetratricopeptide repeat protein [bacterium]|nr:tetratricopeptide repeat protein [bacterium]